MARPYLVPAAGGMEQPLPMPEGAGGWLSPDGKRYAYTPIMREFRTWKRYHGGRAQDVWIYDLAANTSERITDYDGTDNQPVWVGDTIYFTSDRGANGKLNLWAHDVRTRRQTQVTTHDRYDVLWPSGGPGGVVYENGGYIYRFDPAPRQSDARRHPGGGRSAQDRAHDQEREGGDPGDGALADRASGRSSRRTATCSPPPRRKARFAT